MVAAHSFAYQILKERKLAAAVDRDIIYHQMVLRVMVKNFKLYFIYIMIMADINECLLNRSLCEHKCQNTEGSYYCDCRQGYGLSNDLRSCQGK